MDHPTLRGRSILVVGYTARVAMEIATALKGAGANVTATMSVSHAALLAEHDGLLSAAVVDSCDGDRVQLCGLLETRRIPYVSHGGQSVDELMKALAAALSSVHAPSP
jgi:NAD(P)-dependent dehydrogenase (short-subunit alcohol dehydrogenase family)